MKRYSAARTSFGALIVSVSLSLYCFNAAFPVEAATVAPSPTPSGAPTPRPTANPTPTATPRPIPTATPTPGPTSIPTASPIDGALRNSACLGIAAPLLQRSNQQLSNPTLSVAFMNTGSMTWSRQAAFALGPQPGSVFTNPNRVQLSAPIPPNAAVVFSFQGFTPPVGTTGLYRMRYQMVQDGVAWFGPVCEQDVFVTGVVPRDAQCLGIAGAPPRVEPGQEFVVTASFRDLGTMAWVPGMQFRVGWDGATKPSPFGPASDRIEFTGTVPSATNVSIPIRAKAPYRMGSQQFAFRLVQDGVTWFGDRCAAPDIQIWNEPDSATPRQCTCPSAPIPGGSHVAYTAVLHNNGPSTWRASTRYRLGYANPVNVPEDLWGAKRLELAGGADVPPGSDATFSTVLTAPTTPGVYSLQYKMVQDGVAWFDGCPPCNVTVTDPPYDCPLNAPPLDYSKVESGYPLELMVDQDDEAFFCGSIPDGVPRDFTFSRYDHADGHDGGLCAKDTCAADCSAGEADLAEISQESDAEFVEAWLNGELAEATPPNKCVQMICLYRDTGPQAETDYNIARCNKLLDKYCRDIRGNECMMMKLTEFSPRKRPHSDCAVQQTVSIGHGLGCEKGCDWANICASVVIDGPGKTHDFYDLGCGSDVDLQVFKKLLHLLPGSSYTCSQIWGHLENPGTPHCAFTISCTLRGSVETTLVKCSDVDLKTNECSQHGKTIECAIKAGSEGKRTCCANSSSSSGHNFINAVACPVRDCGSVLGAVCYSGADSKPLICAANGVEKRPGCCDKDGYSAPYAAQGVYCMTAKDRP